MLHEITNNPAHMLIWLMQNAETYSTDKRLWPKPLIHHDYTTTLVVLLL